MRKLINRLMLLLILLMAFVCIIPLASLISTLVGKGLENFSFELITHLPGQLGEESGFAHAILGTIIMVSLAGLFSIPMGLLTALYLSETRNIYIKNAIEFSVDLLNGAPSIIIGIFVYFLLVVPLKFYSGLAGAVALSIIIFPIVIKTSYEILKLQPLSLKHGGFALGIDRWKVSIFIVLGCSRRELMPGILNALARASGETAPLLFTAFGSTSFISSLLEPTPALPLQIYQYATSPYPEWNQLAWSASLLLVLMIFLLQVSARLITSTRRK